MSNNLEIFDLSFQYPNSTVPVFSDLSFKFSQDDVVGLYGHNGSGKTTLLNCLSGYYKPSKGSVLLNGSEPNKRRGEIAIIRDEIDLFEYLNIEDNVRFFLNFYKSNYFYKEVDELLKKYNLYQHKHKFAFEASKGMLKKTQIIISLLLKPKLILADELMDAIDDLSQINLWEDLNSLKTSIGTITILSLHDENQLIKHCTKIIYL